MSTILRLRRVNILEAKAMLAVIALSFLFFIVSENVALALPSGYTVESGDVSVDTSQENKLTITASDHAIISFNSFSISQNEIVQFIQPSSSSSLLSRVTGSSATDIYGTLIANGQLVLVNQNGITFHETANIQVQSLIASTLEIQNAMYLQNQLTFEKALNSNPGQILNEADITVADQGHIALLSEKVKNTGTLTAKLGSVVLASGEKTTISFDNKGLINLVIDKGLVNAIPNAVDNQGTIKADGGRVVMNAKTLNDALDTLVNNTGTVEAANVVEKNGQILMLSSGGMKVMGELSAANGEVILEAKGDLEVTGPLATKGNTTLKAGNDIKVNADVTTDSGNLAFKADSDKDGKGAFLQKEGTTVKTTTFGDITIESSGQSTLANIVSAGSLTLSQAGAPAIYTQAPSSTITTSGSFNIGQGVTLNAVGAGLPRPDQGEETSPLQVSVGKDWINQGTFIAGNSTVQLIGPDDATVYGDNTFNNFTVVEPSKKVSFEAGKTQEVTGVLTLKGDYGKLLTLQSTSQSIPWKINPLGQTNITYVLVQNSENVNIHGPPLKALHSDSLGGNTYWDLDPIWTGAGSTNNWSDALNWDTGTSPISTSIVTFSGDTLTYPNANKDSLIDADFQGTIASLTLESGYTGTLTINRDLTITGDVVLNGGGLAVGAGLPRPEGAETAPLPLSITVGGNWINQGGIFNAGTSTVIFNDASKSSTIYGENTFYNFTCTTPGKTIIFEANTLTTIEGTLTIQGTEGGEIPNFPGYVTLKSSISDMDHMFGIYINNVSNGQGDPYLDCIIVNYGHAQGPLVPIPAQHEYIRAELNIGWDATITWNGLGADNNWSTALNWLGGVKPGPADDVVFDATSTKNSTVNSLFGGSIGSLSINSGYTGTITMSRSLSLVTTSGKSGNLSFGSGTTGTLTQGTNILTVNGAYSQAAGTFTGSSGVSPISVVGNFSLSGGTFTSTHSDTSAGVGGLSVKGDFTVSGSPTFNHNSGLVRFNGTANQTVTPGGITLNELTLNNTGASGSDRIIISGNLDVDGPLTITDGNLDLSVNNPNVNLAGDLTIESAGSFTKGTGTLTFDGSSVQLLTGNSQDLGNVTIAGAGGTSLVTSAATFGTLTINSGTAISMTGQNATITTLVNNGTFLLQGGETLTITNMDTDSGTVRYEGDSAGDTDTYTIKDFGAADYYNLELGVGDGDAEIFRLGSNLKVNGSLTINSPVSGLTTFDVTTNNYSVTVGENFDNTSANTFTARSGTVTFDKASGTQLLGTGNSSFYNLTHSGAGTLQLLDNLTVTGALVNSSGTLDLNGKNLTATGATFSNDATLKLQGGETITNVTNDTDSGTVQYVGSGSTTYTALVLGYNYYNLTFNNATASWTLGANLDVNGALTITAGTLDTKSGSNYSINIAGNWSNTGTFTPRSGLVTFDGSGAQALTGETFYNLTINNSAASPDDSTDVDSSAAVTVSNTLTVTDGQFQPTTASSFKDVSIGANGILKPDSSASITVSGTWANSGTFTANSGTVTFNGSGTQTLNSGGTTSAFAFYNLTYTGSGTLQPVTNHIQVNNNLTASGTGTVDDATNNKNIMVTGNVTMSNSTVSMGSGTWTTSGNWDSHSVTTFNRNTSTVVMDGSSKTLDFAATNSMIFYNLTISGSVTLNSTNTYAPISNNLVISNNATLTVPSGKILYPYTDTSDVSVGTGASITGAGSLFLDSSASISQQSGTIDVATLYVNAQHLNSGDRIAAAQYDSATVYIQNDGGASRSISFNAGTTTFTGNVTFRTLSTGNMTIDNSSTNANLVFQKNVSWSQAGSTTITWTKGTGTITFSGGSGTNTLDFNNQSLEAITVNASGVVKQLVNHDMTTAALTIAAGTYDANGRATAVTGLTTVSGGTYLPSTAAQTLTGGLTFSSGTITQSTGTITIKNDMTVSSGVTFTKNASGLIVFASGTATQKLTSAGISIGNIQVSANTTNTTLTLQDALTADTVTVDANQTLVAGGAITATTLNTTAGGTLAMAANALTVNTTLANSGLITVSTGTITISNASSGNFTFTDTNTIPAATYGVLTIDASGKTLTLGGNVNATDLTITAGTLNGGNRTINISGNWSNADTFTAGTSTVIFNGTDQFISGTTTFNNLTKTVTAARTLTFQAGTTQTITGTLDLEGTAGNVLSLRSSSSGTQWNIDPQGTRTVQYLDVKDSKNTNGTAISAVGFNVTDSGNNAGWTFSNPAPSGGILNNPAELGNAVNQVQNAMFMPQPVFIPMGDMGFIAPVAAPLPLPAAGPSASPKPADQISFKGAAVSSFLPEPFDLSTFQGLNGSVVLPEPVSFEGAFAAGSKLPPLFDTNAFEGVSSSALLPESVGFDGVQPTALVPPQRKYENLFVGVNMTTMFTVKGGPKPFDEMRVEIFMPLETYENMGDIKKSTNDEAQNTNDKVMANNKAQITKGKIQSVN